MTDKIWLTSSIRNHSAEATDLPFPGYSEYIRKGVVSEDEARGALRVFEDVWSNTRWENEPVGFDETAATIRKLLIAHGGGDEPA